jgi:hypothetical protein
MTCPRSCRPSLSSTSNFKTNFGIGRFAMVAVVAVLFTSFTFAAEDSATSPPSSESSSAQSSSPTSQSNDQQQNPDSSSQPNQMQADRSTTITIPAGTRLALVLTQPVQSRNVRRGDDIYAQVTSPVDSGNHVVIPPGTFVQGKVDKLDVHGGRGELHLQAMAITFPDGYVAPINGPMTLDTPQGYALKDPGSKRFGGAIAMALGGAGLGAVIGHSVGSSSGTLTSTLPPGCTGPPPGCLSSSVPTAGRKGIDTGIGAVVGGAIGGVAGFVLLGTSHHFYLDVGAPVAMTLQQPITLQQNEVAKAVRQSEEHPVAEQPIAPRPVPPAPPTDTGTCWSPGTPGTPPTVIPGAPGPNGIPGPPTVIPGTPGTPPTPHPCP